MQRNLFDTDKNKGLLWDILYKEGTFGGIPKNLVKQVRDDFENKIKLIQNSSNQNDTLVILNKRILSEMTKNIQKYKNIPETNLITSSQISEQNQTQFNNNMNEKQKEFDVLINKKPPNDIDFSDKLDKPIGSEMDRMIKDTLSRREQELNIVLNNQDTTKADEWINNNNNTTEKHIKIGESASLLNNNIELITKQVTFSENEEPNFLSKLKPNIEKEIPLQQNILDIFESLNKLSKRIEKIEEHTREILYMLKPNK